MVEADLLLLFSDIDGLYDKNPKTNKNAKFISQVNKIDQTIENMAKGSQSKVGTGGMITKIQAAKMALNANCSTIITSGIEDYALKKLFNGEKKFTIFTNKILPKKEVKHLSKSKKNWLSGVVNAKAQLIINQRAGETLKQKKASLLAVGVIDLKGEFSKGDVVYIKNEKGQHIASGVVNYDKKDAEKILKKNSQEIKKILGKSAKPELVHLDNLFIIS